MTAAYDMHAYTYIHVMGHGGNAETGVTPGQHSIGYTAYKLKSGTAVSTSTSTNKHLACTVRTCERR